MTKSFRTILEECINDRSTASRAAQPSSAVTEEWFARVAWHVAPAARPRPARAYAREAKLAGETRRRARENSVAEPALDLTALNPAERADLERLVELGASELCDGLSPRRLKTAYRRLARRHHPDAGADGDHEIFLDVHARYERLARRLARP